MRIVHVERCVRPANQTTDVVVVTLENGMRGAIVRDGFPIWRQVRRFVQSYA